MNVHPTILGHAGCDSAALWRALLLMVGIRTPHRGVCSKILAGIAIGANPILALLLLSYTLSGGRMSFQMGLWPAPFSIAFTSTGFSAIMLTTGDC